MANIASVGVYIPEGRIERRLIGAAWAAPVSRGERAVAAADEDPITLAVAAGSRALAALPGGRADVHSVFFATPDPPLAGVANGVIVAAALDLSEAVAIRDVTGGRSCGLEALQAACEAVEARSAGSALVVVADCTSHEPGSPGEQAGGDAAVAFVLQHAPALAEIPGWGSCRNVMLASWRTGGARYPRVFEPRLEQSAPQAGYAARAAQRALRCAGINAGDLSYLALSAARGMADRLKDELRAGNASLVAGPGQAVGDAGAADPLLRLIQIMESDRPGGVALVAAAGQGAVAAVVRAGQRPVTALSDAVRITRPLGSYSEFAEVKSLYQAAEEAETLDVSPVAYWRTQCAVLRREARKCQRCGFLQFPPGRRCPQCGERGRRTPAALSTSGEVYTFTNDHLIRGSYSRRAQTRCVVDLRGGGRIYTDLADGRPEQVSIGMPVELVLRLRAGRRGFRNYGWKARPESRSDAVA